MTMINNVRTQDRGVSLTVEIIPGSWLATDPWNPDTQIDVRAVSGTFYKLIGPTDMLTLTAKGPQYKKDGTLGNRERVGVSIYSENIPDEVRKVVTDTVRDMLLHREEK